MTQDKSPERMSFFDHLDELRTRLVRCAWVFFAGFGIMYFFSDQIMGFLSAPLYQVLPADQQKLYFTSLFENFMVHLKIAAIAALFVLSPYFFYQLWAFISPGLYPKERKMALPFIVAATFFFVLGAAFTYFVLFPKAFEFFVNYGSPQEVALLTIDSYYTTCLKLLLLFGLAFELPVLISLLGFLGVVDTVFLREKRKGAILIITVVCALFAPPDAISMIIMMIPLILLYELSIFVVQALEKRRKVENQTSNG